MGGKGGGKMRGDKSEDRGNETNDHKRRRDGKKAEGDSERRGKRCNKTINLRGGDGKG